MRLVVAGGFPRLAAGFEAARLRAGVFALMFADPALDFALKRAATFVPARAPALPEREAAADRRTDWPAELLEDLLRDSFDIRLPFVAFGSSIMGVFRVLSGAPELTGPLGKSDGPGLW
jgi:hypothetical protein